MSRKRWRAVALWVVAAAGIALIPAAQASAAELVVVALTQPPATLQPGQVFTSALTVSNQGDTAAGPITFVFSFPKQGTGTPSRVVSIDPSIPCTSYTPRYGNIRRTCTVPAGLAAGATRQVGQVTVTPPATVPFPYAGYNLSVSLTGPTNSTSALYRWRQDGPPNLVGGLSVSPGRQLAGTGPVTIYGMLSNQGYGVAGRFYWHVSLPAGATGLAQPQPITNSLCIPAGDGIDCVTTGLNNGAGFAYGFTFTAPAAAATYTLTSTLDTTGAIAEADETDNVGSSNPFVVPTEAANLAVSVVNAPQTTAYSVFHRAVTITNIGGAVAENVRLVDYATVGVQELYAVGPVPAGVTCTRYVTWSGRPTRPHYHGPTCTIGTIPAGGSVTLEYDLLVGNLAGTYGTTVTASTSSYTDPAMTPSAPASITVVVPPVPNPPIVTALPVVSGPTTTGSTLSVTTGSWVGAGPIAFGYQWQRCSAAGTGCGDIDGQVSSTYVLTADDVGGTVRVVVRAGNAGGATDVPSAPTSAVLASVAPTIASAPVLVPGLEKQPGFAWSVTTGTWNGTPTITFAYQWQRCSLTGTGCVDIAGATTTGYVLQTDDVFHTVRVVVRASNPAGTGTATTAVSPEIDPPD